jgi:hypothetical protein
MDHHWNFEIGSGLEDEPCILCPGIDRMSKDMSLDGSKTQVTHASLDFRSVCARILVRRQGRHTEYPTGVLLAESGYQIVDSSRVGCSREGLDY